MSNTIYLICYFSTIIYFVVLGTVMLTRKSDRTGSEWDHAAKQRLNKAVSAYMFAWVLQTLIYLPPIFLYGYEESRTFGYDLCFLINIAINVPATFMVMHTMLQHKVNMWCWTPTLTVPSLLLIAWYVVYPSPYPLYVASAFAMMSMAFLLIYHASEYHRFVYRIKAEYSDTTGREIGWTWYCFVGFALQTILYVTYQFYFTPILEYAYIAFSILNTTVLSYCTLQQKVLSIGDAAEIEAMEDTDDTGEAASPEEEKTQEEKAFHSIIQQKLESVCERKQLFLEPDLTRDTLCHQLGINRTYFSLYLRSRGTTYYQYINSLRVEYAVRLWKENPDISVTDLCHRSGFSSQPTFRKVFKEFAGCLPSEFKDKHTARN